MTDVLRPGERLDDLQRDNLKIIQDPGQGRQASVMQHFLIREDEHTACMVDIRQLPQCNGQTALLEIQLSR